MFGEVKRPGPRNSALFSFIFLSRGRRDERRDLKTASTLEKRPGRAKTLSTSGCSLLQAVLSFFFSFVFFEEDEKKKDPDEPGNWKMIDTAFIFQVPAHYPVVTFVSSSFFSPSRAREKKEGYNRQIQPEEIDEPNEKWNSGSSHSISSSSARLGRVKTGPMFSLFRLLQRRRREH